MPYIYIGRRHQFLGKTLWEIVCQLKNYGVGRMIIRHRMQKHPEPCFMRIVSAEPLMDEANAKGNVEVEKIFRGVSEGVQAISDVSYKTDYQLIPKHEEYKYLDGMKNLPEVHVKIYKPTADMPPLLKLLAERDNHHAKELKFVMANDNNPYSRIAKEGEQWNAEAIIENTKETSVCPRLYETGGETFFVKDMKFK